MADDIIHSLTLFEWAPSMLSEDQKAMMSEYFKDLEDVQKFYHKLKALLIDAIALLHSGFSATHEQAQVLAKGWLDMTLSISGGDLSSLERLK